MTSTVNGSRLSVARLAAGTSPGAMYAQLVGSVRFGLPGSIHRGMNTAMSHPVRGRPRPHPFVQPTS